MVLKLLFLIPYTYSEHMYEHSISVCKLVDLGHALVLRLVLVVVEVLDVPPPGHLPVVPLVRNPALALLPDPPRAPLVVVSAAPPAAVPVPQALVLGVLVVQLLDVRVAADEAGRLVAETALRPLFRGGEARLGVLAIAVLAVVGLAARTAAAGSVMYDSCS